MFSRVQKRVRSPVLLANTAVAAFLCLFFDTGYFMVYLVGAMAGRLSVSAENIAFLGIDVTCQVLNPVILVAAFVAAESAVVAKGHSARWKVRAAALLVLAAGTVSLETVPASGALACTASSRDGTR